MSLTLRVRPIHLALCTLLFLSSLPPALGVGVAQAASGPTAPAATPAASPRATPSPLSPTAPTTATASFTSAITVTRSATPTATVTTAAATAPSAAATLTATTSTGGVSIAVSVTPTATTTLTVSATTPARPLTPLTTTSPPTPASSQRVTRSALSGVRPFSNVGICPPSWSCADIGSPALAGSQTISNDVWTVSGGGAQIYGTADQFHYA